VLDDAVNDPLQAARTTLHGFLFRALHQATRALLRVDLILLRLAEREAPLAGLAVETKENQLAPVKVN
jgi:hypothetical protein